MVFDSAVQVIGMADIKLVGFQASEDIYEIHVSPKSFT